MIYRVRLASSIDDKYGYLQGNLCLSEGVSFQKGNNIIIGPNGSGKSSLIDAIACAFCSRDVFTSTQERGPFSRLAIIQDLIPAIHSFEVDADYSKRIYQLCTPQAISRRKRDMKFFSPSDFTRLMDLDYSSSGEFLKRSLILTIQDMFQSRPDFPLEDMESLLGKESSEWREYVSYREKHSTYSENSPVTLILDEPDRGFDIDNSLQLGSFLSAVRDDVQMICTLHNPILIKSLMNKEGVHFIETEKGYLDKVCSFCEKY